VCALIFVWGRHDRLSSVLYARHLVLGRLPHSLKRPLTATIEVSWRVRPAFIGGGTRIVPMLCHRSGGHGFPALLTPGGVAGSTGDRQSGVPRIVESFWSTSILFRWGAPGASCVARTFPAADVPVTVTGRRAQHGSHPPGQGFSVVCGCSGQRRRKVRSWRARVPVMGANCVWSSPGRPLGRLQPLAHLAGPESGVYARTSTALTHVSEHLGPRLGLDRWPSHRVSGSGCTRLRRVVLSGLRLFVGAPVNRA